MSIIAACIFGWAYGYWFKRAIGDRFNLPTLPGAILCALSGGILSLMLLGAS